MDRSGEEGCPVDGSLVGLSSFRMPSVELPISSENWFPLVSLMVECQRGSWAFMSPSIRSSSLFRYGLREGEHPVVQLLVGGDVHVHNRQV